MRREQAITQAFLGYVVRHRDKTREERDRAGRWRTGDFLIR